MRWLNFNMRCIETIEAEKQLKEYFVKLQHEMY